MTYRTSIVTSRLPGVVCFSQHGPGEVVFVNFLWIIVYAGVRGIVNIIGVSAYTWLHVIVDSCDLLWDCVVLSSVPLTGSPRLAANPANAILNYLYAALESESRLAAAALGLDPGLGVLHVDTPHRDSLACDLMEPARPQIDAYVVDWITRQPLKREWFFEQRDGNCRLMAPLAVKLSETAPTWGRVVAPFAEWTAQALWDSIRKPSSEAQKLPTHLTQQRRSEGRGNIFEVRIGRTPRRARICEICGSEGVKNRYCALCTVEVSRENMAQVAPIGHGKPRTQREKTRISSTLSNHAIANSWWSPSNLPEWLNEEFYLKQIQPRLRAIKVREIAHAIQVSKPYAALIRAGRRRPHPRHWQELAELVRSSSKDLGHTGNYSTFSGGANGLFTYGSGKIIRPRPSALWESHKADLAKEPSTAELVRQGRRSSLTNNYNDAI